MENQESKYYCRNFSALNSNMDPTSRNISYSVRRSQTPPPPSYNELFSIWRNLYISIIILSYHGIRRKHTQHHILYSCFFEKIFFLAKITKLYISQTTTQEKLKKILYMSSPECVSMSFGNKKTNQWLEGFYTLVFWKDI